MAHLALSARGTIALTGAERPVLVTGNAAAIADALRNIIENSLAHTAPGTEVIVEVGPQGAIMDRQRDNVISERPCADERRLQANERLCVSRSTSALPDLPRSAPPAG